MLGGLLFAVLLGLIGGFGRALQSGGLEMPSRTEDENGKTIYNLGFLGTLGIGAVAGLAAWLFNASPADSGINFYVLGWALVSGVAGDIVLDYYVNQGYGASGTQERQNTGGVEPIICTTPQGLQKSGLHKNSAYKGIFCATPQLLF
jgi:hypothetical protein